MERNHGGNCYPIGWYNLTWKEMLKICHKHLGCPNKKIVTIPKWMYAIGGKNLKKEQQAKGIEGGLDMVKFADLQCSNQFIDKELGCVPLGVTEDDIDAAIGDSVRLCVDILGRWRPGIGVPSFVFAVHLGTPLKPARAWYWRVGTGARNANEKAGIMGGGLKLTPSSHKYGIRSMNRTSYGSTRKKFRSWTHKYKK